MTDSYSDPKQQGGQGEGRREGERGRSNRGGNRDTGGFRIRLSDNEMSAAKALQDAFNLRSPVAVLGFAVRTLGQMLADGKLTELIEQQKSQAPSGGRRDSRDRRSDDNRGGGRSSKPDPFARPSKPKAEPEAAPEVEPDSDAPTEQVVTPTSSEEAVATESTDDTTSASSSSEETSKQTTDPEA
jgi:hypothetical protein